MSTASAHRARPRNPVVVVLTCAVLVLAGLLVPAAAASGSSAAVVAAPETISVSVPGRAPYGSTITVRLTGHSSIPSRLPGRTVSVRYPGGEKSVKLDSSGKASIPLTLGKGWHAGPRTITAAFYGQAKTSGSAALVVSAASTLAASLSKTKQLYLTAAPAKLSVRVGAVDGSIPTGQLLVWDNGTLRARVKVGTSGRVTVPLSKTLGVGGHPFAISFTPNNSAFGYVKTRPGTLTVIQGRTTMTTKLVNRAVAGTPAKVAVSVSAGGGPASGRVTAYENGKALGAGTLKAGKVTITLPAGLRPGPHRVSLSLPTSTALKGSSNRHDWVWSKAASKTTLRLSATSVTTGAKPSAAVTVSGLPGKVSGTMTVKVDGVTVRTAPAGTAHITLPALTTGSHTVTASYGGNSWLTASSTSAKVVAKSAPTSPCPTSARACVDLTNSVAWIQSGGRTVYGPVPITSGRPGYRTSAGTFAVYWKDKDHYSSVFNNAPMPNSVFFDGGNAFHEGSLYVPSHGCIHLSWEASEYFYNNLDYGDTVVVFGYAPY